MVRAFSITCRSANLEFRVNMYKLREERDIKPATFGHLLSSMLYEKRRVVIMHTSFPQ